MSDRGIALHYKGYKSTKRRASACAGAAVRTRRDALPNTNGG